MEASTDIDLATNDLGPLAWVVDELRKSLDSASAALRRFVRDSAIARGTDAADIDGGQLRIARQQLHQAVGALEMVGLGGPAHMLRAMEAAVQKFIERPELCNEEASSRVERAGFAVTEYLEGVLLGKVVSSVALFPQYCDVQEVAAAERIHPADLWEMPWRWIDVQVAAAEPMAYEPAVRSRMDQSVLRLVKNGDAGAAREMVLLSLRLAAAQTAAQPRIFWKICAAYFEAMALSLLPADNHVKRAASRVLMQYAALAKGDLGVSDRLAHDLIFFCAQAVPADPVSAPALASVRLAWGLARFVPVDYQTPQYGRFDPALVAQARKRIGAAKDMWSSLSGGDLHKLKGVVEQFNLVSDSLVKLHPPSARLAQALTATVEGVMRSAAVPAAELAMEVATAVLYLEAAFEDLDPSDAQLSGRTIRLAERLDTVARGDAPEVIEPWMEEIYRRVSDRQTMGSVVGELRGTLGELEKLLDQFFRNVQEKGPLTDAPKHFSQMRGVLSVLGLDQAAQAVLRMRESVEEIMVTEIDEAAARATGTFDKLGNNLGALGLLIDMLNYQPALAKKLFVYDDSTGELRPLMGRTGYNFAAPAPLAVTSEEAGLPRAGFALASSTENSAPSSPVPPIPAIQMPPVKAATVAGVAVPEVTDAQDDDSELLEIFLEEAREVVHNGLAAIKALAVDPGAVSELTILRRAFHTLKGSSRMVGLDEFGEAAWSLEQVLNTWLADQKPANDELRTLSMEAMQAFGRWAEDIAVKAEGGWRASAFRVPADALRTEGRLLSIAAPLASPAESPVQSATTIHTDIEPPSVTGVAAEVDSDPVFLSVDVPAAPDVDALIADDLSAAEAPAAESLSVEVTELAQEDLAGFDFQFDLPAAQAQPEPLPASSEPIEFTEDLLEPAVEDALVEAAIEPATAATPEVIDFGFSEPELEAASQPEPLPEPEPLVESLAAEPEPQPVMQEPVVEALEGDFEIDFAVAEETSRAVPAGELESLDLSEIEPAPAEEQVKVIGSLRLGIPLYNVYLNEADEWSRRLATELAEWSLELNQRVPDSTVGLAHALSGSSATVGFHALSDIARALEAGLEQTQALAWGTSEHGKAFNDAADEIRRLLHQFAAGFLKEPNPAVTEALAALKNLEIPNRADLPEEGAIDLLAPAELPLPEVLARPAPLEIIQPPLPEPVQAPPVSHGPRADTATDAAHGRVRAGHDFGDDQDDIDVTDAIDPDLFPIFEEEALELLPQLGGALRQWAARPDNRSARDEVLRSLHTLKGSARLAGALRLGELAHRMESAIEQVSGEALTEAQVEPLLHDFDGMQANFDTLRAAGEMAPATQEEIAAEIPAGQAPVDLQASVEAVPSSGVPTMPLAAPPVATRALLARPLTAQPTALRTTSNQAVRVRSHLLDRLVNQAGEVIITRSRLESELRQLRSSLGDLTGNLDRLRAQLRDIELQAESQMQSRLAQAKDSAVGFDPLEFDRFTRVQELTRMMAESVNDVATVQRNLQRTVEATEDDLIAQARQTRELQRDLLRTRMMEFEGIADRLYRVLRLASKETGKQVKLDITGGSIEMDRGVLDRMAPAFEHLLRNCVAHGIELPSARSATGKDPAGAILIELHHEGNDVSVEFSDDGAGLDLGRIRQIALERGLVSTGQILSDEDAANLIFMPGFSTASQVTELSGRGIGMDVVRAEVNALGGRIETSTVAGRGTRFKLVLPLTTAVTQVVMIRSGNLAVGVPATLVEIVRRATAKDVQQAYNSGVYEFNGEQVPFYWSGALLQASQRSSEPPAKTLPVVIFRSAAQRVALHVDEVLGNQEVVVKNLGPQLARLPGMAGMTVLASGAVVLIYNPVALTAVYGEQARLLSADHAQPEVLGQVDGATPSGAAELPAGPRIPLVLVVDDSITVRRVTQRLLQREGYRVTLAADGLQALQRLAEEKPTVVLSDIEMPRMDGFDLARNIRGDTALKHLPIIMITSRIAEKHREHAKELGVDHYLGKPYSEEELLSLVKHYSAAEALA